MIDIFSPDRTEFLHCDIRGFAGLRQICLRSQVFQEKPDIPQIFPAGHREQGGFHIGKETAQK